MHADDAVDGGENKNQSRTLGGGQHAAQAEDDPALVLAEHLEGIQKIEDDESDDDECYGDERDEELTVGIGEPVIHGLFKKLLGILRQLRRAFPCSRGVPTRSGSRTRSTAT